MDLKKILIVFINYFITYIFFLIIVFYIANIVDLNRHWSSFYDQEVTLAYNALLFNSGILQEYNEHSGYFTILFLSIFLKIINIIDLLPTYKFSILNNNHNLDIDLQNIIYFTRIYSAICVSFFLFVTFIFINYFAKNKIFSILLSMLILLSVGTVVQVSQLRTELIAMVFLLLSLINLIFFFKLNNNYRTYNICFFFLFLFCSILNKSQTFFYLPCVLLLSYFSTSQIKLINFNTKDFYFLKKKEIKYIIIFIILFYIILKQFSSYNPFSRVVLNIIFLISNIILINLFFYICFKKSKIKIHENLLVINLIMISIFFLFKNILFIHPSTNEDAFKATFTNIMHVLTYVNDPSPEKYNNIFIIIKKIITNTIDIIRIKFSYINFYSWLILLNLLLNYFFRRELKNNNIIFNIVCIIIFFYISSINELRGSIQYSLFSDFFLILSYANFGSVLKKKELIIISILIIVGGLINKNNITDYINLINNNNSIELCKNSYFDDWHPRILKEDFNNFCKKYIT